MTKSVTSLLCDGFETEAFSTWRTIHEVECVTKIIYDYPEVTPTYLAHIEYNRIYHFHESMDKEVVDNFFIMLKEKLKEKELKSKDMKKYLEYGWLYSIDNYQERFPELKLNFRKGIELVAGLDSYSEIYEASSEIAHGSSLLIYSNKVYYRNLSLICLYETFIRLEKIFSNVLNELNVDTSGYSQMKEVYDDELNKNLIKLKLESKINM